MNYKEYYERSLKLLDKGGLIIVDNVLWHGEVADKDNLDKFKNNKFDMVFIDADKMNYKKYYERSLKLTDKGGLIIVDNVLWHGEVANEANLEKYTVNIREFNDYVTNDKRVEQIIVPLGDGMTVCRVL